MAMSREMKVGLFVFFGLLGAAGIIFVIGDNKSLFDSKVTFHGQFDDVQGVKPGSTVRMGGVDIGTVSKVSYPAELVGDPFIDVQLSIVRREAHRIREGSEASIVAKGLLGDKMVTISPGRADRPALDPTKAIPTTPAEDFTKVLSRMDGLASSAQNVLTNLEAATTTLADDQLREDMQNGVAALSRILVSVDSGSGYASRLLNDEAEAARLSNLISSLEQTTSRLDQVLAGLDQAVDRVNSGPGLVHEVVYGESSAEAVAQFGAAAEEVSQTLAAIRQGNGLAHGLLFGEGAAGTDSALGDKLAGDVEAMSTDLRALVSDLRQGKGTLGALLVDPSVYEDLKMLLGNVERNQALRALVRYSIQRDDGSPGVEVVDPAPPNERGPEKSARPRAPAQIAAP